MKKLICFDNGGGATLVIGRYLHHYDDMFQLSEDIIYFFEGGETTSGWEGNGYSLGLDTEMFEVARDDCVYCNLDNPMWTVRLFKETCNRNVYDFLRNLCNLNDCDCD
jgi:hypothetical protein